MEAILGDDDPENQLAGLMSAAEHTPWSDNSKRVTILITDESFSHKDNPGDAGKNARGYLETFLSLYNNNVTNYIIGPDIPGYSSKFNEWPALAASDHFYDINKILNRFIPQTLNNNTQMSTFLNSIAKSITDSL